MNIIRWDPFRDMDRFFDDEHIPMLRHARFGGMPLMDVYQTEKDVVVEVSLPAGIDPEKVDISIEGETLTVRGEHAEEQEDKEKNYYRKEIRRGAFERSVMLPATVKADNANAEYEKGILKITVPKVEEEKAKKVSVRMKK